MGWPGSSRHSSHTSRSYDMVRPTGGKDFRFYLLAGLHGVPNEVFPLGQTSCTPRAGDAPWSAEIPARWSCASFRATRRSSLPPDLVDAPPDFTPGAKRGGWSR